MVVVAITLVLTVIAIPNITNVVANARLRGAATSLSGLLQDARMQAVKTNRTMTVHFTSVSVGPYAYVKDATAASTSIAATDTQVQLGAPIIQVTTPSGSSPTQLGSTELGFSTAVIYPNLPSFNPRGLPCQYSSGTCTSAGFVYYFTDVRKQNGSWTAVSISPAGRIKQWFWYGNKWGS